MDGRFTFVDLFFKSDYSIYFEENLSKYFKRNNCNWGMSRGSVKPWGGRPEGRYLYFHKNRLGSSLSREGYIEYVVIPNLSNPRWIILNNQKAIQNHGLIIKPSSTISRFVWFVAKLLNRIDLFSIIFPYRFVVNGAALGEAVLGRRDECPSVLYTGAPGKFQKFTIQYVNEEFLPEYFLKLSNSKMGIERIEQESIALKRIERLKFKRILAPKFMGMVDRVGFRGLLQSNILNDDSVDFEFLDADVFALGEMFEKAGCESVKVKQYISSLLSSEDCVDLSVALGARDIFEGKEVMLSASHGDYIPWNRFVSVEKIKLIDWETLNDRPLFYDLCYFIAHKSILIEGNGIFSVIDEARVSIARMLMNIDFRLHKSDPIDCNLYILMSFLGIYMHYVGNGNSDDAKFLRHLLKGIVFLKGELIRNGELVNENTIC